MVANRLCRALALLLLLFGGDATVAVAHPLHTTLAQVRYNPAERSVLVSLRVFADDFDAAVAQSAQQVPAVGRAAYPALAYLGTHFALQGPDRRRIPLQFTGTRRQGDVRWIYLCGPAPAGLSGGAARNTLMFDFFSDQVNIVQAEVGKRKQSVLFTRGNGVKRLD